MKITVVLGETFFQGNTFSETNIRLCINESDSPKEDLGKIIQYIEAYGAEKSICKHCGKSITWDGECWIHDKSLKPCCVQNDFSNVAEPKKIQISKCCICDKPSTGAMLIV